MVQCQRADFQLAVGGEGQRCRFLVGAEIMGKDYLLQVRARPNLEVVIDLVLPFEAVLSQLHLRTDLFHQIGSLYSVSVAAVGDQSVDT